MPRRWKRGDNRMSKEEVRKEIKNYFLYCLGKLMKWFGIIISIIVWTISATKWNSLDFPLYLFGGMIPLAIAFIGYGLELECD